MFTAAFHPQLDVSMFWRFQWKLSKQRWKSNDWCMTREGDKVPYKEQN